MSEYALKERGPHHRVTNVAQIANANRLRLEFAYDYMHRRVQKIVSTNSTGSTFVAQSTNRFMYDGWNLLAILDSQSSILQSFTWGQDLSGTMQDADGIGGLLLVTAHGGVNTNCFAAYDGNGNVTALVRGGSDPVVARYKYSAYGELLRATGLLAVANPFRWSTKFWDEESGLIYYGYRYYDPDQGRWLGRDPIEEKGGLNLHIFVSNQPSLAVDRFGENAYYPGGHHIATMQLAETLPDGPGTKFLKKFTVPAVEPHYNTREHRAYNAAVGAFFEEWLTQNGVTRAQVAQSAELAQQFVQDVMAQPKNNRIGSYLSKAAFLGGKALKAAVIIGGAFASAGMVYSAYAGGNDVVMAAHQYQLDVARGADWATLDLAAIEAGVHVQTMTGDYFVTMWVLDSLLQ